MGTRVYVGRISHHASERDIERFFKGYGRVRDIMLKNGYGFVEFEDYRDADDAVYELNGKDLCGERVCIEHARGTRSDDFRDRGYRGRRGSGRRDKYGPPTRTEHRLIVENLSSRVSWQDLKDYMRQAGEVTYADAHKKHRNEGIIEFATESDMQKAIKKLDGTEINGRKIRLVYDGRRRSRSSRSRSRSRNRVSRSHSRSASRSRSRSKSRSRSRSAGRDRSRSKSRSATPERKKSVSRSRSRSRSRSQSRSRSRSHSRSSEKAGACHDNDNEHDH